MRLYIAVLDGVPDYIVPTLVAHTMLGAHLFFTGSKFESYANEEILDNYFKWLDFSFKKCVVRVNQKEFDKIANLEDTYLGHENTTLGGIKSCAIPYPREDEDLPKVLKFAKLWKPNDNTR